MTTEEIKAMFQASATLRHCKSTDPQRPLLEDAVEQLTRQYVAEFLSGQKHIGQKDNKISLQEAFDIIVKTCQSATSLELEHHPGGITDEQVQTLAATRKMALDRIVKEIASKN